MIQIWSFGSAVVTISQLSIQIMCVFLILFNAHSTPFLRCCLPFYVIWTALSRSNCFPPTLKSGANSKGKVACTLSVWKETSGSGPEWKCTASKALPCEGSYTNYFADVEFCFIALESSLIHINKVSRNWRISSLLTYYSLHSITVDWEKVRAKPSTNPHINQTQRCSLLIMTCIWTLSSDGHGIVIQHM